VSRGRRQPWAMTETLQSLLYLSSLDLISIQMTAAFCIFECEPERQDTNFLN
jgi:hypothetical protein